MQAPFQWKCLAVSRYFWNDDKGNIEIRRIDIDEYWNLSEEIVRTTVEHIQYCSAELMIYVSSWYFIAVRIDLRPWNEFLRFILPTPLEVHRSYSGFWSSVNQWSSMCKTLGTSFSLPVICRPAVGSLIGNECFWSSCGWQGLCASHFMGGSSLVIFSRFVLITLWGWLFEIFVVVLMSWLLIVLQHLWMTLCFFESKLWN